MCCVVLNIQLTSGFILSNIIGPDGLAGGVS